jgi:hypothetical protein
MQAFVQPDRSSVSVVFIGSTCRTLRTVYVPHTAAAG